MNRLGVPNRAIICVCAGGRHDRLRVVLQLFPAHCRVLFLRVNGDQVLMSSMASLTRSFHWSPLYSTFLMTTCLMVDVGLSCSHRSYPPSMRAPHDTSWISGASTRTYALIIS